VCVKCGTNWEMDASELGEEEDDGFPFRNVVFSVPVLRETEHVGAPAILTGKVGPNATAIR
jgi:hypothetical protein